MRILFTIICTVALIGCTAPSQGQTDSGVTPSKAPPAPSKPVILATTTSTQDSGLLDTLIPTFEKESGIQVKTIAVGTGQALELGRRGEADVLLVHAPSQEEAFVRAGHGKNRRAVMHNDFVLVGPKADPAGIAGTRDVTGAMVAIHSAKAGWVSRGDRSGTHTKERALWSAAGVAPTGEWYIESGQGMGASLRIANEKNAYILSDRGTFLAANNLSLVILCEGDERLFNPYHVMEVTGANVNKAGAEKLAAFLVSKATQERIAAFTSGGHPLFTPDALPDTP